MVRISGQQRHQRVRLRLRQLEQHDRIRVRALDVLRDACHVAIAEPHIERHEAECFLARRGNGRGNRLADSIRKQRHDADTEAHRGGDGNPEPSQQHQHAGEQNKQRRVLHPEVSRTNRTATPRRLSSAAEQTQPDPGGAEDRELIGDSEERLDGTMRCYIKTLADTRGTAARPVAVA